MVVRRPTSLLDSMLEYIPTSRDIMNVYQTMPSLSVIFCGSNKNSNNNSNSMNNNGSSQSNNNNNNNNNNNKSRHHNHNREGITSAYTAPNPKPTTCKTVLYKFGLNILQQILKNPHQSIAMSFLLCVTILLVIGQVSTSSTTDAASAAFSSNGSTTRRNSQIIKPNNAIRGNGRREPAPLVVTTYNNDLDSKSNPQQHAPRVTLPSEFDYLAQHHNASSSSSSSPPITLTPTPIFWYLPRSGGNTIAEMFGKCRNMIIAGAWTGDFSKLEIIHDHGLRQVTADLTTKEGRNRARDLGLKDANPNILILSPNVYETSDVFPVGMKGPAELWAWFRHPVERQISMYFWMQSLPEDHPQYTPEIKYLSLGQWAQTHLHQPNAMLATLLGVPSNPMGWTEMDLTIAKNVLRDKAHIGLLSHKTESVLRFLHNYGQTHRGAAQQMQTVATGARECQERLLDYAWKTKGRDKQSIGQKSDAYQLLLQSNSLDMKLYDYAVYLFGLQGQNRQSVA